MPSGKVKWYSSEKGFGFLTSDQGEDVYVHSSSLPNGVATLKPGARVEFGVAEGRRGAQALSVRVLDPLPSVAGSRKPPEDMAVIVEDLIRLLDGVGASLRRGRQPDASISRKTAAVLRAVADDLDA